MINKIDIEFFSKDQERWNGSIIKVWTTKRQAEEVLENTDFLSVIGRGEKVSFVSGNNNIEYWHFTGHFINRLLEEVTGKFGFEFTEQLVGHGVEDLVAKYRKKKDKEIKGEVLLPPQRVVVPDIGYKLHLSQDWTFKLKNEYRNKLWEFLKQFGNIPKGCSSTHDVTIMAGSILTVDRVYIRKGGRDYSSVTFYLFKGSTVSDGVNSHTTKARMRFFANINDVNQIIGQWDETSFV
jgi:hypothetical protein